MQWCTNHLNPILIENNTKTEYQTLNWDILLFSENDITILNLMPATHVKKVGMGSRLPLCCVTSSLTTLCTCLETKETDCCSI